MVMSLSRISKAVIALFLLLGISLAQGHGVRDRTRAEGLQRDTAVTASQAAELTLTLVAVAPQMLQTWVRTAATIDASEQLLTATLCSADADLVRLGQRVRAFPPDSKSSIYQARISALRTDGACRQIEAKLARRTDKPYPRYVMEIIVQRGYFLAIPSEAIIEEGERQIVYVFTGGTSPNGSATDTTDTEQKPSAHYQPRPIRRGLQGELYSEVLEGLRAGEQVVTLGSFFIDAEHKLKASEQANTSHAHHHH